MKSYAQQRAAEWLARPRAIYRLIQSLAALLSLLMLGWVVFYLFVCASSEVSQYRRDFNNNYTHAFDYFERNEVLLGQLRNAVEESSNASANINHILIPTATHANQARVYLSPLLQQQLGQRGVKVLFVDTSENHIHYLLGQSAPPARIPPAVKASLIQAQLSANEASIYWVSNSPGTDSYYVFTPYDPLTPKDPRWIGLQIPAREIRAGITPSASDCCHEYLLRDSAGTPLMMPAGYQPPVGMLTSLLKSEDGFGVVISDGPNVQFRLKKVANASGWTLGYLADAGMLFNAMQARIAICLLLYVLATLLLFWGVRYVDRSVLRPAQTLRTRFAESDAFNREVIDLAPVGLCVLRQADGSVVRDNAMARHWLQGEYNTLLTLADMSGPNGIELRASSNRDCHLHATFAYTRFGGEPVLLCALSDISSRKHAQEALAQAKDNADKALQAKSIFLATMSHEIRTPLYGVLGTVELLGLSTLDHMQRQQVQTIHSSSKSLLKIINDILDLSKIEANQLRIEAKPFSPLDLIEETMRTYAATAAARGLDLHLHISPDIPAMLIGDAFRLQQVLSNLLGNAIKFTPSGSVTVRLQQLQRDNQKVTCRLQVLDTGIGIAPEDHARLFEPFIQIDQGSQRRYDGTGLGLSICQRLVALMNGKIEVSSTPGQGSCFSVTMTHTLGTPARITLPSLAPKPVAVSSQHPQSRACLEQWLQSSGAFVAEPDTLVAGDVLVCDGEIDARLLPGVHRVRRLTTGPVHSKVVNGEWQVSAFHFPGLLEAVKTAQGMQTAPTPTPVATLPTQMGLRVLVAEDHPANQMLLRSQLQRLGCEVVIVGNGVDALSVWHQQSFDCVLTDIDMPRMDGYTLTRALRKAGATLPIIGVTASAMREDALRCHEAGMVEHLAKPLSLEGLRSALTRHCKHSTHAAEIGEK